MTGRTPAGAIARPRSGRTSRGPARGPRAARIAAVLALAGSAGVAANLHCARAPLNGAYAGHNLLLISIDTLRADHLGAYGYARDTSPWIDAFATESVLFERAYAPVAATWPSLVSMLTSLAPRSSNVRLNGELLEEGIPTLQRVLRENGYATAAFLANACEAFTRDLDDRECVADPDVTAHAVQWLRNAPREPWFLWLHYFAPHHEYRPPPAHDLFTRRDQDGPFRGSREWIDRATLGEISMSLADRAQVAGLYDGEVHFADSLAAGVWKTLSQRGLTARTLALVTADHGEELGQHHDYFYHLCSVHEPALRIPLILRLPDGRLAGRRTASIVENVDIAPTLLALLGVAVPRSFEGSSLVPLLASGDDEGPNRARSEYYRDGSERIVSLRTERWRYVYNPGDTTPFCIPLGDYYDVEPEELYDHASDPDEARNVVAEYPGVTAALRAEVESSYHSDRRAPPIRADRAAKERLRALGYIAD